MDGVKDEELQPWLRLMVQGNTAAFHEIYSRINDHIYRTVYFLMPHKVEVEDVVSEVYIALFQALPSYDFDKPFRTWLNGIIIRQTSNWKRKLWRIVRSNAKNQQLMPPHQPPKQPEEHVFDIEGQYEMLAYVDRLPTKLRQVIVLRYYQDCSYEEIAASLDIPVGTAKSRHHLAIRRLREFIDIDTFHADRGESVRVQ
ncbi:RNA polymerase sigma factor [Paenibacillus aceti]|uniref:RNA polymerase sigma factor n=1 Tax=Paenibacillus aceti TaxID=1820010 RepID=A0ABQ1VWC1_9BACL|nr:sigma-70 family RNA polymerase sigma factor [Paenibacillus aceti]GGG01742.1 RNA polymerase sigma factor [Paenibacillus aceti]